MCAALLRYCRHRPPARNPDAGDRGAMSRAGQRFVRSILIGTACLAALVWMAVRQFGVAPRELFELLLASGLVVVIVIGLAGATVLLWLALRKCLAGRGPRR